MSVLIKMKYKQTSGMDFQQAMQKLIRATTDGMSAYKIKKVFSALKEGREKIAGEYAKDIVEVYAKRDEKGGYDINNFTPMEDKIEAYQTAVTEFGERELVFDRPKLTMHDIRDAKLSAAEQMALEPVLDDSDAEKQTPGKSQMRLA